jgi:hypothetical protein
MKKSTEIYTEIQSQLARLREIDAEVAQCQPIAARSSTPLSTAEKDENHRRITRLDGLAVARTKVDAEYAALRRRYVEAMTAEQVPAPSGPAPIKAMADVSKLKKQIAEAEASIADLPEQRRPYVVAASRGDRKALEALDKISAGEQKARDAIALATAAIAEIESQNAEIQREFAERDADARFAAAQSAGEDIAAIAHNIELAERSLGDLYRQWEQGLRAIRKTGATFDDARLNTLVSMEIRHRSAKANGVANVYGISVRDAVGLEDAARMLLRLAIQRPTVKDKAA